MQKQFLRFLDLGQNTFWQLIQEVREVDVAQRAQWQKRLQQTSIHLWHSDKNPRELPVFLQYLQNITPTVTLHDCSNMPPSELEQITQGHDEKALHIACGFSESDAFVLAQNTVTNTQTGQTAPVAWFNGVNECATPWQAMAEIAFLLDYCQSISQPIDSCRICWLGGVSPLAQSLMTACIYAPFELFMGIPPWKDPEYASTDLALKGGAKIFMTREPRLALDEAHIIYMDKHLEELAENFAAHGAKVQQFTPITGAYDDFVWPKGLQLSEKELAYAQKDAPVVSTDVQIYCSNVNSDLQEKRKAFYADMLLATLCYVLAEE